MKVSYVCVSVSVLRRCLCVYIKLVQTIVLRDKHTHVYAVSVCVQLLSVLCVCVFKLQSAQSEAKSLMTTLRA